MRVILFTDKKTGEVEIFSSLKPFLKKYPQYKEKPYPSRFEEMSRKKVAIETDLIKIERVEVQT